MRRSVALVALAAALVSIAACDEDKKEESLISKVTDAEVKPATTAAAPVAAYDAAPPPKKKVECARGPDVDFHGDAALEAEVRKKLGKDGGVITQGELRRIKSINLSTAPTNALDPCVFPLFTGMHDLFLGPGDLDDLTPIAGLTQLITLRASINHVSDLTPLEKMTKLDRLDLGRTSVHDIAPLGNLTALTELLLDDTQVEDLSPLATCKSLEKLSIRNTPVVSLAPLKDHKKLRFLYIEGAPIQDTTVLDPLVRGGLRIVRTGKM